MSIILQAIFSLLAALTSATVCTDAALPCYDADTECDPYCSVSQPQPIEIYTPAVQLPSYPSDIGPVLENPNTEQEESSETPIDADFPIIETLSPERYPNGLCFNDHNQLQDCEGDPAPRIYEDSPEWDCTLHGNLICGPPTTPEESNS